jgi:phage major head subunit gpT-like protein
MQSITEREYQRLVANLWWQTITKVRQSQTRQELITWLLSTAMIRDTQKGGQLSFDDLVATYTQIENKNSGAGLVLKRAQMEDLYNGIAGGEGMDLAGAWASDIGQYMAYWPQKQVAFFLKNAHLTAPSGGFTGYDGVAFFTSNHPVNPMNTGLGTFQNIFTGGASGSYPGACPIDDAVDIDDALVNLSKIYSYLATIKMPNGEDPRFLRPRFLIVPPRMFPRAVQLTSAKFIAQTSGSGAGGADVEAVVRALGYAAPVQADELAGFESDTTFFVAAEQVAGSTLGGVLYLEREAYRINYYGQMEAPELNRKDELEWHVKGRNVVAAGHPYLLFKCKGS